MYFIDFAVLYGEFMQMKITHLPLFSTICYRLQNAVFLYFIVVILFATSNAQAANALTSAVNVSNTHTHIEFETDELVKPHAEMLNNPNRIVLDVAQLKIGKALNQLIQYSWKNHARIARLRMSQFKPDVVRIVIDLKKPASFQLQMTEKNAGSQISFNIYPAEAKQGPNVKLNSTHQDLAQTSPKSVDSGNAGAQIILDREPVFEPDLIEDEIIPEDTF